MGTNPFDITDKTKDLNDRFYLIMNKIVDSYPSTKLNPNDSNFNKGIYNENMKKMENLQNEYFLYKNEVMKITENIQNDIMDGNDEINALEEQNKVLRLHYDSLKSSSYSAEGLFDDAQISRNQLLVSNIILFCIIAGGGFMYYKKIKQTQA
jgi:hypothetical protein